MTLHLIHRPGAAVIPLARPQREIGDDAISLGLIRMVERIADRKNPDGLVMSRFEVADIVAGLALDATPRQRETALQRIAENHADWTNTPGGQTEVTALVIFIAPHCPPGLWQEVVEQTAAADDPRTDNEARAAAESEMFAALHRAVCLDDRVVPFPSRGRHRAPEGPGAA